MELVGIFFVVLILLNVPIGFTIGISSLAFFFLNTNVSLITPVQSMVASTQSFPLLAVPFFVLAGNLMNATGITSRLIKFSTVLTGHMRGGLAQVSVVLSTLMGGISGSAVADAAMEARILGPEMAKRGYPKGYAAAVIALPSLITATIPPGVGLILYGVTGGVSIGKMFVGGIIPGFIMMIILMITAGFIATKRDYPVERETPPSGREVWESLKESIWALLFPVILIVGIRFGVFTASEAGAFAVIYAFVIGKFVYKELSWQGLLETLKMTIADNGVILFIIMASGIFGYAIIYDRVPQSMATLILGISDNSTILLLIILAFVFICGMFMEATANTLLLTPIFLPIVISLGIDPVHFGIIFMTIVTMGGMTPPVGAVMYTTCSILDCPVEDYIKESMPFILAIVIQIIILIAFPGLVTFLPNLIF
ncbi:TRAP dicarboxylate transporter, DctM subunit [Alkaliphilus metalliredigens QYMF]|uniref:TRAP dicarboxylate transporter, DctM subunit n=1 Tax=Alkaliphilus metalliredigens (strain QYMF) TaxID=293826 RepID=A6TMS7_ALKMQ|nr:TRAP transporter large permease [Alkaliphilus metalliredigens]ABR47495.1 TRAP dicarboxylate transporter, DctM subunit [Alkaliphilus metalliredigens QYMF]